MAVKVLQINFRLKASTPDYQSLCQSVAQAFAGVPGLRWKIWLLNDHEKEPEASICSRVNKRWTVFCPVRLRLR